MNWYWIGITDKKKEGSMIIAQEAQVETMFLSIQLIFVNFASE